MLTLLQKYCLGFQRIKVVYLKITAVRVKTKTWVKNFTWVCANWFLNNWTQILGDWLGSLNTWETFKQHSNSLLTMLSTIFWFLNRQTRKYFTVDIADRFLQFHWAHLNTTHPSKECLKTKHLSNDAYPLCPTQVPLELPVCLVIGPRVWRVVPQ